MTAFAVPTGPAGPGPSGPAGPHPSGPAGPSGPPSKLAESLDAIDLMLRTAELVTDRQLAGADPAARMALADRLRLARRAVADLQTPSRRHLDSAAAVAGGTVQAAREGADRAGRPPAPGTDFRLPPTPAVRPFAVRTPPFELSRGPQYDVLPQT